MAPFSFLILEIRKHLTFGRRIIRPAGFFEAVDRIIVFHSWRIEANLKMGKDDGQDVVACITGASGQAPNTQALPDAARQ